MAGVAGVEGPSFYTHLVLKSSLENTMSSRDARQQQRGEKWTVSLWDP